jgi:hypothetical protein
MIWLGILIGFILGLPIGFIKWKKKPAPVAEKYTRRGLLGKEFSVTEGLTGRKSTVECNFEIGELESIDTLSKVDIMNIFEDFKMPFIKYISEQQSKSEEERTLYYLGGEPEENHSRLTVGKQYVVRTALYSPSSDAERVSVWICSDDENKGKICQINLTNFGTFAELRDRKINQIINN